MSAEDPLLERTLAGRYRLISRLGSGGMSAVYLARHVLIDRLSAIKVLHAELSSDPSNADRFLREARAVNRINHPNIVEISDYGEAVLSLGGREGKRALVYLVMEYVPGESLRSLLQRTGPPSRITPERMLPIAAQVASALARAHQTGVVHRDVKPDNILLVPRRDGGDLVKLTDFGAAKVEVTNRDRQVAGGDQVFGTPGYIAPEYLVGETAIDGRADLYSLGIVMYEALTGDLPFDGDSPTELLTAPMSEDPIPARTRVASIPVAVESMIMACLKRRPDDRPHDAFALLEMIHHAAAGLGIRAGEGSLPPAARSDTAMAPLPSATALGIPSGPGGTVSYGADKSEALRTAALEARGSGQEREAARPRFANSMPPPPRIGDGSPANLVQSWRNHYDDVERRLRPYAKRNALPTMIEQALERRTQLIELLDRTAHDIVETQETLDLLSTRGRDFRATLGRAIDHIGRDLSRAHGKVLELKARRVDLHLKRRHTEDPGTADAILWEEAAIDQDMRRAVTTAADLGHQLGTLQDELFARNNSHEAEALRATGILEGESAALSTLHRELELLSGEIASFLSSA